ncbi:hypothetical protein [Rubritalea tangerina]|uniref:hypothetical protein n=1 Tax=Rubritalea tangerina TaxID=430798 RepID=UPI003606C061
MKFCNFEGPGFEVTSYFKLFTFVPEGDVDLLEQAFESAWGGSNERRKAPSIV